MATELHFGRAAQKLHMGQSTLSDLIQRLEREMGTPLLMRTTRRVALSSAGAELLGAPKPFSTKSPAPPPQCIGWPRGTPAQCAWVSRRLLRRYYRPTLLTTCAPRRQKSSSCSTHVADRPHARDRRRRSRHRDHLWSGVGSTGRRRRSVLRRALTRFCEARSPVRPERRRDIGSAEG